MSADTLIFLVIAVPVMAVWLILGSRYARANLRWFSQVAASEGSFVGAVRLLLRRGPWLMFREDTRDSETEALRQEAVARFRPMMKFFIAMMATALLFMFVVVVIIVVHAIVT